MVGVEVEGGYYSDTGIGYDYRCLLLVFFFFKQKTAYEM